MKLYRFYEPYEAPWLIFAMSPEEAFLKIVEEFGDWIPHDRTLQEILIPQDSEAVIVGQAMYIDLLTCETEDRFLLLLRKYPSLNDWVEEYLEKKSGSDVESTYSAEWDVDKETGRVIFN